VLVPEHRVDAKTNKELVGPQRGEYVKRLTQPAIEGYPVGNQGNKVDFVMAYVGTRTLFEAAGFAVAGQTSAVSGGFPRVLMRRAL